MDINIRITLDVPRGWARRLLLYVAVPVAIVVVPSAVAHAIDAGWIGDGKEVSASALGDNFKEIESRLSTLETYEGFYATAQNFQKTASWNKAVAGTPVYNTFGGNTYDPVSGVFTAPKAGYYRFGVGGLSPTATTAADSQVAFALIKNNDQSKPLGLSGGQLSTGTTPLPTLSHVVPLAAGDTVWVICYTVGSLVLGDGPYLFWFQGEYVGK